MNDFEINIKQIILSLWKIRYYIILSPCIFILLLFAYSFTQKVFPKNILVYYIQFIDTQLGNSLFINDTNTPLVYRELEKKWDIDAIRLKNSFTIDAISPETPFIQKKYRLQMTKPDLKPSEIDAIGERMVKDIKNANRLSVKISFDYQDLGLSVKQATEILTSFPSLWNRTVNNSSNLKNFYISPDLEKNISKSDNVKLKALVTYETVLNAIKTLEKIKNDDNRSFLLLATNSKYTGGDILERMKLLKSVYLIPYFNSEVNKESSEVLFFLNNLKMNKFELEEKISGIDRTISSLRKDNANGEKVGVMTSNAIDANAIKMIADFKYNKVEAEIFLDNIQHRSELENELAKTKRVIAEIQSTNNDKGILTEYMYKQIFESLKTYNAFINAYKVKFMPKNYDRYTPLIEPQLIGSKDVINIRNLIFAGFFGLCIGIVYGLIFLFILDFKSKTQINDQSRR